MSERVYLSVKEFAEKHGLTERTLRRWIREKHFPHAAIGSRYLIPSDAFDLVREGK